MGLFNALGNNGANGTNPSVQNQGRQGVDIAQMYKNFKATLSGDPNEILRHGVESGRFRPEVVEQAKQILGMK